MTARAVAARPPAVGFRVPAVASTVLRQLVSRAPLCAVVLGTSRHAVWLLAGDDVVVLSTRDATRLPNGVELALRSDDRPFASISHGTTAHIDSASIEIGDLSVDIARWWDPRPALGPTRIDVLAAGIDGLPGSVAGIDPALLGAGLPNAGSAEMAFAVRSLLGRGPGLTPEGDDYLAGALCATRNLGAATGSVGTVAALDRAAPWINSEAVRRTTAFSTALIRCALRGEVADPAGALLRAVTGRGDVAAAHRALTRVGHSSGPALAAGIVLGARSLVHHHATNTGGFP